MNKRGSLALSTNAIVVLIIAITILGLSLAFTRNIFGSLGEQIEDIGGQTLIDNPPTYENPLTLSKAEFEIRRGRSVSLGVGFFNYYDEDAEASISLSGCFQGNTDTLSYFDITSAGAKSVKINREIDFSTSISADEDSPSGVHACTIKLTAEFDIAGDEYEYQDMLITVK
jgi:hypothetical protein